MFFLLHVLACTLCLFFFLLVAVTSQSCDLNSAGSEWETPNLSRTLAFPLAPAMPTEVPYAADAEISLTYDELDVLPTTFLTKIDIYRIFLKVLRLQYEKELQDHVTVQTKFNYAWGLVKSPVHEHQVLGVKMLQGNFEFDIPATV